MFDEKLKRFKYTITFEDLYRVIDKDMIENHSCLLEVLNGLFEGFEENPEALKKLEELYN